ncbi:MAG: hypothetical protein ACYCYO_00390 [Bacilli bacterium]
MKERPEDQTDELEEGLRTIARRMLEAGDSVEKVAKLTGLTGTVVSQIASQLRTD